MSDRLPTGAEPAPHVSLDPTVRVAAGSSAVLDVLVTNTAAEARVYTVLTVGVDSTWLPGPVRTPVLSPGESTVVGVVVAPVAGTLPARYPILVTVQPLVPGALPGAERAAAAPSGLGESAVVVNPRAQLTLEVEPTRAVMVRSNKLRVTVRNGGDSPADVELGQTASKGLEVRLRGRTFTVPPGGSKVLKGRLVATRPRRVGSVNDHSWAITATTAEVVRHARGTAQQRPLLAPALVRAVAVLAVVAVWIGAAIVALPLVLDTFGGKDEVTAATVDGGTKDGGGGAGGGADGGAGGGAGGGADGGADGGGAGGGGASAADVAAGRAGVLLNGTIMADDPSGFTVSISETSLYGDVPADTEVPAPIEAQLASFGMIPQRTVLTSARAVEQLPSVTTKDDGAWAIERVTAPAYYVLTMSKPGYDTRRFLVDASAPQASDPREVEMKPGRGRISGRVLGPAGGAVGAASVTVSDGTTTLTTNTQSEARGKGGWAIGGLDAPGTYVVSAGLPGLGSSSRVVRVNAAGQARADLRLSRGLVSLTGRVTGLDRVERKAVVGLPEVSITISDGDGVVREASTITRNGADTNGGTTGATGSFALQGLPTPGSYTVAIAAEGYQTETRKLVLARGEIPRRIQTRLREATGVVRGNVSLELPDATPRARGARTAAQRAGTLNALGTGLVLANDAFTYKVQVQNREGAFSITGVTPGVYQLTTSFFGFTGSVVTVEVMAGKPTTVNPTIVSSGDGGLVPTDAHILFKVLEANIGIPVECHPADLATCITATVSDNDGTVVEESIPASGQFKLPNTDVGLAPGLYTVDVSADGYETQRLRVQLGQADKELETVELFRQPVISGRIKTVSTSGTASTPSGTTCVWAVPVTSANATTAPTVPSCVVTADGCGPDPAGSLPVGQVCTAVEGRGDYTLQLPKRGDYWIVARASDPEYVALSPSKVNAPVGSRTALDIVLSRYARLTLVVLKASGASGALSPAIGAEVRLTAITGGAGPIAPLTVQSGGPLQPGAVQFSQLPPGIYEIEPRLTTPTGDLVSDPTTQRVTVDYDQDPSRIIPLVQKIERVPGRVVGNVSGTTVPVPQAAVSITAPSGYSDTTPISSTVSMTANDDGCFAITPEVALTAFTGCPNGVAGAAIAHASFVTPTATEVSITATGYEPVVLTGRALTTTLNTFAMEPASRPFSGSASVTPADAAFDWSRVTFTVSSTVSATAGVSVRAGAAGALTWVDSRYGANDRIKPGTYTVTAALTGYSPDSTTITCPVFTGTGADPGCTLDPADPLTLLKYGSLNLTTVSNAGTGIPVNATVSLYRNGDLVATRTPVAGGNSFSFTGLVPSVGEYTLRIKALGYATVEETTDTDIALSCTPAAPTGPATTALAIDAGTSTTCVATLNRLPDLVGTVSGSRGSGVATNLVGATVAVTRCDSLVDAACPAPTGPSRAVTTDALGGYRVTATDSFEGLRTGYYRVTASLPGWDQAPAGGVVVHVDEGVAVQSRDLAMTVRNVTFTVQIKDGVNSPVPGAAVSLSLGGTGPAISPGTGTGGGSYVFPGLVPDFYTLTVSGDELLTSTFQVEVRVGAAAQVFPVFVSRGANAVQGTVTGDGQPLGQATVKVVRCPGAVPSSCSLVNGTDGQPLSIDADGAGIFGSTTIPDGTFRLQAIRTGFATVTGPEIAFDHTRVVGQQDISLTSNKANVQVRVVGSQGASDDLSTTLLTLTAVPLTGHPDAPATPAPMTGSDVQFSTLRYGCWDLGVTLPDGHYGDVGITQAPAGIGECSSSFSIPTDGSTSTIVVTVLVTESRLRVTVNATAQPGHTAPTTATVTVSGHGVPDPYPVPTTPFPVGSPSTIWVAPTFTYTVRAAAGDASTGGDFPAVFWPATQVTATVGATGTTSRTLQLTEVTSALTVTVENLTGATGASYVTVAPGAGQTGTVPAAYLAPGVSVADGASTVLDLPSGAWIITATPVTAAGGTAASEAVTLTTAADAVTVRPTEPAGGGGAPGSGGGPPP